MVEIQYYQTALNVGYKIPGMIGFVKDFTSIIKEHQEISKFRSNEEKEKHLIGDIESIVYDEISEVNHKLHELNKPKLTEKASSLFGKKKPYEDRFKGRVLNATKGFYLSPIMFEAVKDSLSLDKTGLTMGENIFIRNIYPEIKKEWIDIYFEGMRANNFAEENIFTQTDFGGINLREVYADISKLYKAKTINSLIEKGMLQEPFFGAEEYETLFFDKLNEGFEEYKKDIDALNSITPSKMQSGIMYYTTEVVNGLAGKKMPTSLIKTKGKTVWSHNGVSDVRNLTMKMGRIFPTHNILFEKEGELYRLSFEPIIDVSAK